jgi:hypothetical protein
MERRILSLAFFKSGHSILARKILDLIKQILVWPQSESPQPRVQLLA